MTKQKPGASLELVAAIRSCAERGLTQVAAMRELTTDAYPLTRGAIAGIASREEIVFPTKARGPDTKPRRTGVAVSRVPLTQYRRPVLRRAPGPQCSWAACTHAAEPGDLFCHGHGKRALI